MSSGRLFLTLWLLTALLGLALALQPVHPLADVSHYKLWTRLVATRGIAAAYAGEYPDNYVIYPPVTIYGLALVGALYRSQVDADFDLERALASQELTTALRLLALVVHLALGVLLFRLLREPAGERAATLASSVYLLNPGALWDVAVWAQPDSWHSLFAFLGLWSIGASQAGRAGLWLGLAALTKPQAWLLLPLAAVGSVRFLSPGQLIRFALAGLVTAALVASPFLLAGRWRDLLTLPGKISTVMPVVSANAHNFWWLLTAGAFPFVLDSEHPGLLPGLTYRQAALLLLLPLLAFSLWRTWLARTRWELLEVAAFTVQGWFCLTTGAHENHQFMLFPLLAAVCWRSRLLALLLGALVLTFSLNVLLHDFGLVPQADELLGRWSWPLQRLASQLNLLIAAVWLARLAWTARSPAAGHEGGFPSVRSRPT